MNMDFAKLLNNCLNRMDGKDDDTGKNDDDRDIISERVEISSTNNSPVRSEIKDIIEERIKQKDTNVGSPVQEQVDPIQLGGSDFGVELEEASEQVPHEKAKILFSLKDFFERSKESENYADNASSGEDSNDAPSDLDKNVESLYNDEDQSEDGDSDVISDDSDSELEEMATNNSADSKKDSTSDKESDIEDKKKGDESDDHDSDLESELNLLEKLKQKLDSITGNPNDLDKDESIVLVDEINKKIKEVKETDDENDDNEKGKDKLCSETKEKLGKGSDIDPIKIIDDVAPEDDHDNNTKKDKVVKSMFKNISISIVGANFKTIDLESLLKKSSTSKSSSSPTKQTQNVFQKPNISVKRKSVNSPELVLSGKRFRKFSILLSSDEDSPRKESVPTVTIDENTTIEDISDDEKENIPKENVSSQYDNCTHGDPMDYMCVECTFNRWRCEWDFVKPVRVKKIKKINKPVGEEVNPVEIIQAVNWEKVFKFAGVGLAED